MSSFEHSQAHACLLRIEGAIENPLSLTHSDLAAFPESDQVCDVSRFHPNRSGDAVALAAILKLAVPHPGADYATLHADRDNFHVSVPLDPLTSEGMIVYRNGNQPLAVEQGGPVRLLIRNPKACHTGELDECANVKYLSRIEITLRKGIDTRPLDEAAHAALHASQK